MNKPIRKRLYLPAYVVIGVVFIQGIILAISIYQNMNRMEDLAFGTLFKEGEGILAALEFLIPPKSLYLSTYFLILQYQDEENLQHQSL